MLTLLGRIVLFLVFAFGTLIGVIYPWVAHNQTGYEIGRWEIYSQAGGFAEVEVRVQDGEQALRVHLDVQTSEPPRTADDVALEMLVRSGTTTVQAEGFRLGAEPQLSDAGTYRYAVSSKPIIVLPGESLYRITFAEGSAPLPLVSADMTVIGGLFVYDASVPPIGWALMAVAGLSWAFTFRRRKPASPSVPQWGRGERS